MGDGSSVRWASGSSNTDAEAGRTGSVLRARFALTDGNLDELSSLVRQVCPSYLMQGSFGG